MTPGGPTRAPAMPHSRFTVLFERLAIDALGACDVDAATGLLRISWDEAWHLMDRAVARERAAKPLTVPAHVGVDEKATGRWQDYITIVSDLDAGTVEHVAVLRSGVRLEMISATSVSRVGTAFRAGH